MLYNFFIGIMLILSLGLVGCKTTEIQYAVLNEHVFIVEKETKDIQVNGKTVKLANPYFPTDSAIVTASEYFNKIFEKEADDVLGVSEHPDNGDDKKKKWFFGLF